MLTANIIISLLFPEDVNPIRGLAALMTGLQFPEPPASGVLGQDHNQLPWRQMQLMYCRGDGGGDCLGDLC